jgi:hypothetical protein
LSSSIDKLLEGNETNSIPKSVENCSSLTTNRILLLLQLIAI